MKCLKENCAPITVEKLVGSLSTLMNRATREGLKPIVITNPSVRASLRHLIEKQLPQLPVLSYKEVARGVEIKEVGTVANEILI